MQQTFIKVDPSPSWSWAWPSSDPACLYIYGINHTSPYQYLKTEKMHFFVFNKCWLGIIWLKKQVSSLNILLTVYFFQHTVFPKEIIQLKLFLLQPVIVWSFVLAWGDINIFDILQRYLQLTSLPTDMILHSIAIVSQMSSS